MIMLLKSFMAVLISGLLSVQTAQAGNDSLLSIKRYAPSLTGRYLVASPNLTDPTFHHTVVYMVHHDKKGAMGLVINRRMARAPIGKLMEALGLDGGSGDQTEVSMYYGGPVEPQSSLVLHRNDYRNATTTDIGNHLAVSNADHVLTDLALGRGPADNLLILGYAGWASEQLENEINAGAWYVIDADDTLLFDDDLATKWQRALRLRGLAL